jgi:putative DNA primase/helicase
MDGFDDDRFSPLTESELAAAGTAKDDRECVMPVPADAPAPPDPHRKLGEPSARWPYRDAFGALLFEVWRFDPADKRKQFLPLSLWREPSGRLAWDWKAVPPPRPLYGLDQLAAEPEASVVICEGEKSVDAAAQIFSKSGCITSPGGCKAAGQADWAPLAGRRVLIWPDADEVGATYAREVAGHTYEIGCEVSIIDAVTLASMTPDGGSREPVKGWDAADAIGEWENLAALRNAAHGLAKPYEPGPQFVSWGNFTMNAKGLTTEVTKGKGDNATAETVWIASAFEVIGACRDPQGFGWGKWLRWKDRDGRIHTRHVTDAALQGEPASLCAMLADEGLSINRTQQQPFLTYLSGCNVKGRVTIVRRTGWHDIRNRQVFVLPSETIGPTGSERVILDASAAGPYEARGTLKDWQDGIGKLSSGHALPVLAISAAFAGPLLKLAGQEGGGVHIFGASSKGKTTIIQAAASAWGRGATPGYVRSWRATANGLEGVAASASDTVLILDELNVVDARDAASSFYGLANGSGKARAARDGSLREPKTWRVLILSTGEVPTGTKLAEDRGRKARAGQLVRMLDIPADRNFGFGAFDHGGQDGDAGALAKVFKHAAISAYGTAGPEFVRRIVAEGADEISDSVRDMVAAFIETAAPAGSDGQIDRAAQRLGLIAAAGELATSLGVTPWQEGEARSAAAWALGQWINRRGGTEPAEVRQAIEQVRLFIEQHGESRFDTLDDLDARPVSNRAGWRKGSGPHREWMVPPEVWKTEICNGLDATLVARTLAERGMVLRAADGFQPVRKIDGANKRVYAVTGRIFDGGGDEG